MRGQTSGQEGVKPLENAASKMTIIPIVLCLLCGVFSGTFTVALLFRRIAIALAIAGPVVFSALWIWWDWDATGPAIASAIAIRLKRSATVKVPENTPHKRQRTMGIIVIFDAAFSRGFTPSCPEV